MRRVLTAALVIGIQVFLIGCGMDSELENSRNAGSGRAEGSGAVLEDIGLFY